MQLSIFLPSRQLPDVCMAYKHVMNIFVRRVSHCVMHTLFLAPDTLGLGLGC